MLRLRKSISALFLGATLLAFFCVNHIQAQSILDGKLTGTITDDTGEPLPGVTVEVTSPALITGKRSTLTSDKGVYVFLHLPVGRYDLKASLQGFKSAVQTAIHISAGSSVVVNLTMAPGAIEEEVTVTAVSPVVDARTSAISTNIESDLLDKMPTSRDAFYDLSLTTPGMVAQGKDGTWLPSPNAYGSTSNENVFLVNGVNTTNPRAAAYGSLVQVNYNAVEEVRVIALGSKAEYGNFTGVAIDVLTKSGSNEFHGNAALYSILGNAADNQPEPMVSGRAVDMGSFGALGERLLILPGDDVKRYAKQEYEGNFTLGGPIIRDKIWFYGGFDYVKAENKEPFWGVMNRYWGRFGDIKITGEPWANHRAWLAYHYENNDGDGWTWDPHWDSTMTYGQASVTHSISSQWQWLAGGNAVLTAKYLGFWRNDKPHIPADSPANPGFINWWKWNVYGVQGAFPYVESQKSSRNTIQADLSYYAEDFLGEHDIKFGVQYTSGRGNWMGGYFQGYANFAYPMRWTQNIYYMQSWYGDTGLIFYNRQTHLNPFLTVRTADQRGLFIDDQWTPFKRLTVNLGLRFDMMTSKYGKGKVYEQPSTPEDINNPPPEIRDRRGTTNIFDFRTWAPRVGITFALTKDMKTVLRANYGRYYLPTATEYLRRFGPDMPEALYHYLYYNVPFNLVDLNGNNYVDPIEVTEAARYLADPAYAIPAQPGWPGDSLVDYSWQLNVQENLKNQHTDQFTFNIERELFADFSISATYIYKRTANIFVNWPLNEITKEPFEYGPRVAYTTQFGERVLLYDIVLEDYNGDGNLDGGDVQWIGEHLDFQVRNMPEIDGHKPIRTYNGLQFTLKKRYSKRWQMLGSVLFSKSNGMAARSIRQDFNFEGPMVMDTLWLAGLNATINTMEGPLPHTQKFEIKLSGSYRIPMIEADIGFRFRYNSGRPLWPLEVIPVWQSWQATRPGPEYVINTGDNYIVSINPKDPWYLPAEKVLDLRLDKSFTLARYGSIHLGLDVLNVFNEHAVTNAGYGGSIEPVIGRVSGLTYPSRKVRLSLRFEF